MSPCPPSAGRRGLRVAVVAKQVPRSELLELGPDGRLLRHGIDREVNPHCRRAVSQGVELATDSDGTCVVYTLGPPEAEDVTREAVAWGADRGVHLCDPLFAGSDSLATAHALAAALRLDGPWDLVLCGRSSVDAETGQVGPQLAELLGLPFVGAAAELEIDGDRVRARCELGDGWRTVRTTLPAVISCAERLIAPCKAPPSARAAVPTGRLHQVSAADLGPGPWGVAASPTRVGASRGVAVTRLRLRLTGPVHDQAARAAAVLVDRGLLAGQGANVPPPLLPPARGRAGTGSAVGAVVVAVEPGRDRLTRHLLGMAAGLADQLGRPVVAAGPDLPAEIDLASWGADRGALVTGASVEEDVAAALARWCEAVQPWAVLGPSTAWGREVLARLAVRCQAGLTGDAVELEVVEGRLTCWKPALSGRLLVSVTSSSKVQLATVRPGASATPSPRPAATAIPVELVPGHGRGRTSIDERVEDPQALALQRAPVVVCVGRGVPPDAYGELDGLLAVLGAELGATRKVTDQGWLPRSLQVGITGWSLSPALYVGIGTSGRFNHLVGVAQAGTVVVITDDPAAPGLDACDVGIVADWREAVPALLEALTAVHRQHRGRQAGASASPTSADAPTDGELSPPSTADNALTRRSRT